MRTALAVFGLGLLLAAFPNASQAGPTPTRSAQEAAFMRLVKPNQTVEDMTSDVLAHTGEHVAYNCQIEELTRTGVVVGQCGPDEEPVDVYLKLPGTWRIGQRVRVLGILDTPASWSDVSGHTIYYPFVRPVFVDRLK
jgi:hypothetical protein